MNKKQADEVALWFVTNYTRLEVEGPSHRALVSRLVSLPTSAQPAPATAEETQAGLLERATRELDELRTALEQQSTALARLQTAHLELRAAYDQRGKAIESATTAANRFNKALWAAVEKLGEGEVLEAERVMKGALE